MLKKQQVSGTQTLVRGNPNPSVQQGVPYVSHILMVEDARRVAVYDNTSVNMNDKPVWARNNAVAGEVYSLNCPCPIGISVEVNGGLATIIYDDRLP